MNNKQQYTPIRFSHLTSYAGVGSIIRGSEDKLMVILDTRYWKTKNKEISSEIIPYVTRIIKALNINKELRMPPIAKEDDSKGIIIGSYLPAVLFPTYAFCKKCGLLHKNPWKKQNKEFSETVECEKCSKKELEQVTWCAISNKGHLDDAPWHLISHKNNDKCHVDFDSNYLKLDVDSSGRRIVKCNKCKSYGHYEKKQILTINKQQPWIYGESPKLGKDDVVEILEVNNPGVYLPERINALVIPPESRMGTVTVLDKLYSNSTLCRDIEKISRPLLEKAKLKEIAREFRCNIDEIKSALAQIKQGYPFSENKIEIGELIEDEYSAFLEPLDNLKDDEDFVTDHKTDMWKNLKTIEGISSQLNALILMIDNHIVVKRLREIQIFKGFYRSSQDDTENLVPPDIIGKSKWLPAIELFGEGVFFTIDKNILSKWEDIPSVKKRADEIEKRYETSEVHMHQNITISPRFLLLHTISHLLIRELEVTAGYPAASLNERIYCSKKNKMSGILIYTAVADIVGSLGGIVESAEPKEFLKILDNAFKHAQWCSLDPVCSEHEGQGPGWLNRAACHACLLIPEPSCEYGNMLLDRVLIKGSKKLGIPNFLDFIKKNSHE